MTSNLHRSPYRSHPDPVARYQATVRQLHQKLGQIASNNLQTCGHLSRVATALRAMAGNRAK